MYKMYEEGMRKYETEEGIRVSLVLNGARSRQVAGDLSPWRRKRRGACIGSSTPLKTEQHLIPTSLSSDTFDSRWPHSAEALQSPLTVSTHEGYIYDRANSSDLQATAARGARGRVVVNDTTSLSEGLSVINDTTDLSEWLPVINDTTNLSEGLPVINDTSAKMTCVVVLSINDLMTCVVAGLCGL